MCTVRTTLDTHATDIYTRHTHIQVRFNCVKRADTFRALKCKRSPVPHRYKYDSRWFEGVFLGFKGLTNEFLIGTPEGVKTVRTIRRKPIEERWDIDKLNKFKGLPWRYKAGVQDEPHDAIEFGPANQPLPDGHAGKDPLAMGGQPDGDIYSRNFKIFGLI